MDFGLARTHQMKEHKNKSDQRQLLLDCGDKKNSMKDK